MEKMILYHIKENMILVQKENLFLQICGKLHIPVKKIVDKDLGRTIGELAERKDFLPVNKKMVPVDFELPELLVFSGLKEEELDQFLKLYREKGLGQIPLKAIVTPVNVSWQLFALIEELENEHKKIG